MGHTDYFDTKEEIQEQLKKGLKPDFGCSRQELQGRAMIRDDMEEMMNESPFDYEDYESDPFE